MKWLKPSVRGSRCEVDMFHERSAAALCVLLSSIRLSFVYSSWFPFRSRYKRHNRVLVRHVEEAYRFFMAWVLRV